MPIDLPLEAMSREDKLRAMEILWKDLSQNESAIQSPDWHGDVLEETEKLIGEGKAKFSSWEEAKIRLREQAARLIS